MENPTITSPRRMATGDDRIARGQVVIPILRRGRCLATPVVFSLIIAGLMRPSPASGQSTREEAVALARAGETEKAIAALRRLLGESPGDKKIAYDLAVILTWVNRPKEATDAFERAGTGEPPEYVLGPVIRAYRDQKRFKEAEKLASDAARRFPLDPTWVKLRGLLLTADGRAGEAMALLQPWAGVYPDDPEMRLALDYASKQLMRPSPPSGQSAREEAVALVRSGEKEKGIAALRRLLGESPSDKRIAYDLAVVLTWDNRSKEATDAFERAGRGEPPEYVLGPIIHAYRDQKRFKEAEMLASDAARRFPLDPAWVKLRGLLLTDQGRAAEAIALLQPWAGVYPNDAELWLALGYASKQGGDRFAILRNYGHVLRLQPNNREAAEAMAGSLSELGAPFGAELVLGKAPLPLQAHEAGLMVRWGDHVTPLDPRLRFEGTDAALARLDQLLKKARSAKKPDRQVILQLRRDQVVALRNRERWEEAIAAAASLRADDDKLPPYVLEAEADALLAARHPKEARLVYEEVLRADPKFRDAQIGRFFALVEEENFTEAFRQIDQVAAQEQPGPKLPNQNVIYPNDKWLEGEILAGRARYFADMHAAAWKRLYPLAEAAPANAELRALAGEIAASREWPRRSDEEIHIAASLAPDDRDVQIGLAESAMRRRRWKEARERVASLERLFPGDVAVDRTQMELWEHDAFELRTEATYRHERGSGGETSAGAPGSGTELKAWLFTPPIHEDWRLIGAWEWSDAKVVEGIARRYREGVGVELALPDLTMQLMGWNNDGSIAKLGGDVSLTWQPSDHWTFSADAAYFTAETPLRAVLNQITANSVGGSVQYTWHESRSLSFGANWYDFSDGNRRHSGTLTFNQKVVDIPHFDVTLRPEIYASENSSNQGPYFSPLRDFSAALTVDAEHVIWRRYERSFGHRLALTAAGYWQKNFGSDWIGNILYEQVYQHYPRIEVRYGVQFNRAIYDGDETPSIEAFLRLNLRF